MERTRLVTLTGPGGTGKTRLAIEAAHRVAEAFPDGTFFVDLSPITDPRVVGDAIASALRLRRESGIPVVDILVGHLRDRTELLVLDNFEQVLEGADTVAVILRGAPKVHVLVTSRAPLGVTGEREVPVPPLGVAEPTDDPSLLRRSEAVALFVDRARAVDPAFTLTDETLEVVAEICARLDGLPLAIELAASRARVLHPRALLDQLDRRLPLLVGGPRDAPVRQRTLSGAIAWSYDLLDEPASALFRRFSVFAGGCTLDMAGQVANPQEELGNTLALLDVLVQHSLLQRPDEDRLRMLETIREFGIERLDETDEAEAIHERHARAFVSLAEEAEPYLTGPEQGTWLELLSREHDNLRAALAWAIGNDRGELALRVGAALWRFWYARGHMEEARRWLEAALALRSSREATRARARCLTALGGISYWQGDFGTSHRAYEEALEIYRERDDRAATVEALSNLGQAKGVMGEAEEALALLHESLTTARELEDRRGEAWALWGLAAAHYIGGDLAGARVHGEESRRLFEAVGEDTWGLGNAIALLAGLSVQGGDPVEARRGILTAIDTWGEQGNALLMASQLRFLAIVANNMGQPERAARLAGAFTSLRERFGGDIPDAFFPFPDPRETAARLLDPATVDRAWAEGTAMSLEEALAYAREEW